MPASHADEARRDANAAKPRKATILDTVVTMPASLPLTSTSGRSLILRAPRGRRCIRRARHSRAGLTRRYRVAREPAPPGTGASGVRRSACPGWRSVRDGSAPGSAASSVPRRPTCPAGDARPLAEPEIRSRRCGAARRHHVERRTPCRRPPTAQTGPGNRGGCRSPSRTEGAGFWQPALGIVVDAEVKFEARGRDRLRLPRLVMDRLDQSGQRVADVKSGRIRPDAVIEDLGDPADAHGRTAPSGIECDVNRNCPDPAVCAKT